MFKKIRNVLTKITNYLGGKTGMYKTLDRVTDHPDIKLSQAELIRIGRNKNFYKNEHEDVVFIDSNGERQTREYNAVNLSKIISRKIAKLVFNEGVNIELSDHESNEFINKVLHDNRFEQVFGEELEGGYAISGLAIVPDYDPRDKTIKFKYCSADNFIPLDGNTSVVTEAAILNHYRQVEGEVIAYYTLFAIHKRTDNGYKIIHELYRSEDSAKIGQEVSLKTIPETEQLAEEVDLIGLERPLFVYIKLAGKNNVNYGSPLGLGVIDNAYKQLCNFNDKYDMYMNEIDTATRQLVASSEFFEVSYDSFGVPRRTFNPKTQIWQKLQTQDPLLQDFTPAIRAAEFIDSLNFILRIIEQSTGFSSGTFSFDGKSFKTATEVISENTDTYQTRADNVLIVKQAITDLILNTLYLGDYYDLYNAVDNLEILVDFDDGVFTSKTERQEYAGKAKTFGLLSTRSAMMKAYGLTWEQANEEYAYILEEQRNADPTVYQGYAESKLYGVNEYELDPDAEEQPEDENEEA